MTAILRGYDRKSLAVLGWTLLVFLGLGMFLESWGTSRNCRTYYTGQVPPPVTAAAHGFAQILYARVLGALDLLSRRMGFRWRVGSREYGAPTCRGRPSGAPEGFRNVSRPVEDALGCAQSQTWFRSLSSAGWGLR